MFSDPARQAADRGTRDADANEGLKHGKYFSNLWNLTAAQRTWIVFRVFNLFLFSRDHYLMPNGPDWTR